MVSGEGHYLGEAQTLALMKTEYVYPELGNRQSVADWIDAGASPIWERARERVKHILQGPHPGHLPASADARIRGVFDIKLNPEET